MDGSPGHVAFAGSVLFAVFLAGWGTSLLWGPTADRWGRIRTLAAAVAWPESRRKMGAGYLGTGCHVGFFLAAALNFTVGARFERAPCRTAYRGL
jgi:MFS family permease